MTALIVIGCVLGYLSGAVSVYITVFIPKMITQYLSRSYGRDKYVRVGLSEPELVRRALEDSDEGAAGYAVASFFGWWAICPVLVLWKALKHLRPKTAIERELDIERRERELEQAERELADSRHEFDRRFERELGTVKPHRKKRFI